MRNIPDSRCKQTPKKSSTHARTRQQKIPRSRTAANIISTSHKFGCKQATIICICASGRLYAPVAKKTWLLGHWLRSWPMRGAWRRRGRRSAKGIYRREQQLLPNTTTNQHHTPAQRQWTRVTSTSIEASMSTRMLINGWPFVGNTFLGDCRILEFCLERCSSFYKVNAYPRAKIRQKTEEIKHRC